MNIEIENIDSCKKKIKFDIAHKDYQAKVQNSYLTLARQVKVPGFRPGKAPLQKPSSLTSCGPDWSRWLGERIKKLHL